MDAIRIGSESGMGLWEAEGIRWLTFPALEDRDWLLHGFTTRIGGTSHPPYDTLNMGLHVGDLQSSVLENRHDVLSAIGMAGDFLTCGEQTHGVRVALIDPSHAGRGGMALEGSIPDTDALVTRTQGIPLGSFYADCVPVFLVDPTLRTVGLAHAGWKGALGRIAGMAVSGMVSAFGSDPGDIMACIGPHIRSCCFQVDSGVADKFMAEFPGIPDLVIGGRDSSPFLNLEAAVRAQLSDSGCKGGNIHTAGGLCTSCRTDLFFSHRAENGRTGRMASLIQLTGGIDIDC